MDSDRVLYEMSEDIILRVRQHIPLASQLLLLSSDDPSRCVTTDLVGTRSNNGYPQIRINNVKYKVHRAIALRRYYSQNNCLPNSGLEASHLCSNSSCVREFHLIIEDGDVNKSRICCRLYNHTPNYFCPHSPVCIYQN